MIDTSRCKLSMIQEKDFDGFKKLYVDERVRKYLGGPITDEKLLRNRFAEVLEDSKGSSYYWSVKITDTDAFIGMVSLNEYHDGINTEISYQFLPEWWGSGYATEVVRAVIRYAFDDLGLQAIVAETQTANGSSCRLMERVGMEKIGQLKRFGADQTVFKKERPRE